MENNNNGVDTAVASGIDQAKVDKFSKQTHFLGRVSSLICIVAMLAVPFITQVYYGVEIDKKALLQAISILSVYLIVGVVEVLSYGPILGSGATYLAFITGNVSNMKLPAAIAALKISGAEQGSEKGKIVSTLAVGVSSVVTTIAMCVGMLALSNLLPVLQSPVLKPGFDNLIYALMGAFVAPIILKSKRSFVEALAPMILMALIAFGVLKVNIALQMPLLLLVSVLWSYILYRTRNKKATLA